MLKITLRLSDKKCYVGQVIKSPVLLSHRSIRKIFPFPGHLFKIIQNPTNPINLDGTFELIVNKTGMEVSVLGLFLVPSQEYLPFLMS